MPWGAVAVAVVGAYSANQQKKGAQGAANAAAKGEQASIAEQRRQFDLTRQDMAPFLDFGKSAIPLQQAFLAGDFSGFEKSPDYLFAKQQGLDAIDHRAAARGGLFGGGNTRDAVRFASGLATQNADNHWNKLAGISGQGQTAAQNLGVFGQNAANNIGNSYARMGELRGSSYQQAANANSQLAGMLGGMGWQYFKNNQFGGV